MYRIHHTEAIILAGIDRGESDRELICYTRHYGLIRARVKSIREMRSRLRYALRPYALASIDCIRAKNGWKITSARPKTAFPQIALDRRKRVLIAQQFALLRRLIQGEEAHTELFEDLLAALATIESETREEQLPNIELVFVVRMLRSLGYWAEGNEPAFAGDWSSTLYEGVAPKRKEIVSAINSALEHTQL